MATYAASAQDWKKYIVALLKDSALRKQMGKAAREKVEKYYSVQANCRNFLDFFFTD
jgi:glycosyltransferase involved in cell wall biosynthesis